MEPINYCFECGNPSVALSLSYGIYLCQICAAQHRSLGSANTVIPISAPLSEVQEKLLEKGGNDRLSDFFDSYNMPKGARIHFKYNTLAAAYYKEALRCEAENVPCEVPKPSVEEGLESIIEQSKKGFFENALSFSKSWGNLISAKIKPDERTWDKITDSLKYSVDKTKHAFEVGTSWGSEKSKELWTKSKDAIQEANISEKSKAIWSKSKDAFEEARISASNTYQKVAESDAMRNIKEKTLNLYESIASKDEHKEDN